MLHFEWSKAVKRPSAVVLRARRRGPRSPWTRFVPRLDPMEDRTLLSTWTVMNNYDSGAGSLRYTIDNIASSGDTIVFAPKLQGGQTITLTSGELDITKNLTISGPGAKLLTISGNNTSRVFDISGVAKPTVTLANLTIAYGKTISTGTSGGALGGGGILNNAGAKLNLTSCSLVNNTAYAGAGLDVFGGGLLNLGTAIVTSCTFTGNQALNGAGTFFAGSQGGALDNFGGAQLEVDYSTFTNNQAIGGGGTTTTFFGVGGAIENNNGSTAKISYSTFTGNLATAGNGGSGNGGAICSEGSGASVTLTNSTLAGNRSIGGPGGNGETTLSQGLGGGILNGGGSTLTVRNSTLSGNQAIGGAHSHPTTDNPLTGAGSGGGIANIASGKPDQLSFIVSGSTFTNNLAQGGADAVGLGGTSGVGGGIENSFSSTAAITNSTLSGNQAIAGPGGSGASVPTGLGAGGGIDDSFSSTATITNSTLIGNQAIGSDGSSGANGGNGWGGGIVVGINNFLGYLPAFFQPDTSSLIVSGSTLIGNRAQGGAGGSGFNGGNGWGGGLMIDGFKPPATGNPSATVNDTSITGNQAIGGAGVNAGEGVGGGVFNEPNGVFTPVRTVITGNHASTSHDNIGP